MLLVLLLVLPGILGAEDNSSAAPYWGPRWVFSYVMHTGAGEQFSSGVEYFSGSSEDHPVLRRDSSHRFHFTSSVRYIDYFHTQSTTVLTVNGTLTCTAKREPYVELRAHFMCNTTYAGTSKFAGQVVQVYKGEGNNRFGEPVARGNTSQAFEVYVDPETQLPVGLKTSRYVMSMLHFEKNATVPQEIFQLPPSCPRIEPPSLLGLILCGCVILILFAAIVLVR